MSQSLKDTKPMHTDQYDPNVISPVVNSSDETGEKTIKLELIHLMSQ